MSRTNRRTFFQKAGFAIASTSSILSETQKKKDLFVHHVFFYLKNPTSAQDEAQLLEGLEKLSKVPTIQFVHIGHPASTNRDVIEKGYSVSWLCFFKNLIEEEIYQTHPIHLKFIADYSHLWEKVVVYDSLGKKR